MTESEIAAPTGPTGEKSAPVDRDTSGPFDVTEARDVKPFVDFGGILILPQPGLQIRLEVEESSKRVVAIGLELAESTLQVQAFAASRSEGLWGEIRAQVIAQLEAQGGSATEVDGPLGPQLAARTPAANGNPSRDAIFIGVDGPRWFLRGVIAGRATTDASAFDATIALFRSIVVNRGSGPMPPRDLIPLRIPAPAVAPGGKTARV